MQVGVCLQPHGCNSPEDNRADVNMLTHGEKAQYEQITPPPPKQKHNTPPSAPARLNKSL